MDPKEFRELQEAFNASSLAFDQGRFDASFRALAPCISWLLATYENDAAFKALTGVEPELVAQTILLYARLCEKNQGKPEHGNADFICHLAESVIQNYSSCQTFTQNGTVIYPLVYAYFYAGTWLSIRVPNHAETAKDAMAREEKARGYLEFFLEHFWPPLEHYQEGSPREIEKSHLGRAEYALSLLYEKKYEREQLAALDKDQIKKLMALCARGTRCGYGPAVNRLADLIEKYHLPETQPAKAAKWYRFIYACSERHLTEIQAGPVRGEETQTRENLDEKIRRFEQRIQNTLKALPASKDPREKKQFKVRYHQAWVSDIRSDFSSLTQALAEKDILLYWMLYLKDPLWKEDQLGLVKSIFALYAVIEGYSKKAIRRESANLSFAHLEAVASQILETKTEYEKKDSWPSDMRKEVSTKLASLEKFQLQFFQQKAKMALEKSRVAASDKRSSLENNPSVP